MTQFTLILVGLFCDAPALAETTFQLFLAIVFALLSFFMIRSNCDSMLAVRWLSKAKAPEESKLSDAKSGLNAEGGSSEIVSLKAELSLLLFDLRGCVFSQLVSH